MTLGELARRLECPLEGDSGIEIHRVAKIETAGAGDVTFLANPKYAAALASTKASAVIAGSGVTSAPCAILRSATPYLTFARAAQALSPDRRPEPGVHPQAWVAADATVDPSASLSCSVSLMKSFVLFDNNKIYLTTRLSTLVDCRIRSASLR